MDLLGPVFCDEVMVEEPGRPSRPPEPSGGSGVDDAALVDQVRNHGSRSHFRLLVQRHQGQVSHVVASVLGPRLSDLVEETTQEVFVKIYRGLANFDGRAKFSTWAYRVAYNTAIDQRRSALRHPTNSLDEMQVERLQAAEPGPAQAAADADESARLQAAIDSLPDIYRTIIHLHYWRGYTVTERN